MAAGGRYDGLVEELGGRPTPGVGFGSGIERVVLGLKNQAGDISAGPRASVFVAYLGERAQAASVWLAGWLRERGTSVQVGTGHRSLRAQLRAANQAGARYAVIIGDDEMTGPELQDLRPVLRDLASGEQEALTLPELFPRLEGALTQ